MVFAHSLIVPTSKRRAGAGHGATDGVKVPAGRGRRLAANAPSGPAAGDPAVESGAVLVHCASQQDDAVVKLVQAATRIGLDICFAALISGTRPRPESPACSIVVLRYDGDGKKAARILARHLSIHRNRRLVLLADQSAESHEKELLARGAVGFIPARFSADAMAAALLMVRAGEIFAPHHGFTTSPGPDTLTVPAEEAMRDFRLTKVEREVLALAAQGLTNLEIARRRSGTEGTIKVHMNHIFAKLNVRSRVEAIAIYLQTHNVDPEELRRAQSGDMDMKWLLATMTHEHHMRGTVLFRRGQHGDKIYYLQNGLVHLQEIDVDMQPRDLFGEIGVFAHDQKRTCTAVCKTEVDLFTLSFDEVRRCYFLNPQFAFYVMYLITNRLMADRERFQDSID